MEHTVDLTPEQAYRKMVAHFSQDGARLSKRGFGCYYRHPEDGRPCAVGAILPDEYAEWVEKADPDDVPNTSVRELVDANLLHFTHARTREFCQNAQAAHDKSGSVQEFLTMLDRLHAGYLDA